MISPEKIAKKAERKYRAVLRAHLSGEPLFPMMFPVGRLSKSLVERRQQIDELRQHSREQRGQGYTLEWQTVNRRDLGKQSTPRQVVIESLDDYLAIVRRRTEYTHFTLDVERIRRRFPDLEAWLYANPQAVIEYGGRWDELLTVCAYFVQQPRPNRYIRELPIPVHTKFIEQHSRILRELLDTLLPPELITVEANDFTQRFGLKSPPPRIRLRLLEAQLDWHCGLQVDDLTLPIDQAAHLLAAHIRPKKVLITENLINFLTLPKHPDSVGLFGRGFAVHLLAHIAWLNECQILYWGDIDAHGFQILSDLRRSFPHVCAVMMDQETLEDHVEYVTSGSAIVGYNFAGLTATEAIVAQHVLENNLRLEQEHIPHEYALIRLKEALRTA